MSSGALAQWSWLGPSCPVLSWPVLSWPVLSWPVRSLATRWWLASA
jgi:hypothetical protein